MTSKRNLEARARIRRHHPTALARLALSDQATEVAESGAALVATNSDDWGGPCNWLEVAVRALHDAEELVTRAVIYERARGTTWEEIGDQFGITKQSAQARYADDVARWEAALHAPFGPEDEGDRMALGNLPGAAYDPDKTGPSLDQWARDWRATFDPRAEQVENPVTGGLPELTVSQESSMVLAEAAWCAKNLRTLAKDYVYLADFHEWKAGVFERQAAEAKGLHKQGILDAAAGARALAEQYRAQITDSESEAGQ